ncbi:unnamed protein product [Eruca vesicaria subsp. sativa]|uniref:Protein TIFY n=1 Tax=Eruca vesicaria subsp. sativa TaxID=29727 RepID=A0ABC8M7Z5_ERUVS|nr:unnamed protein product [Eruca vesicaria subsp. sativa]
MNLFPIEDSLAAQDVKPRVMCFLWNQAFLLPLSLEPRKKSRKSNRPSISVKVESQSSSPLTIFYDGQVMVFDDFPADKAKQVIDLPQKGSAKASHLN